VLATSLLALALCIRVTNRYINQILEKRTGITMGSTLVFIDFEKASSSVRREVLPSILFEFDIL
jgi:hypothetical protein